VLGVKLADVLGNADLAERDRRPVSWVVVAIRALP
jgi:hypothetical protein